MRKPFYWLKCSHFVCAAPLVEALIAAISTAPSAPPRLNETLAATTSQTLNEATGSTIAKTDSSHLKNETVPLQRVTPGANGEGLVYMWVFLADLNLAISNTAVVCYHQSFARELVFVMPCHKGLD